LTNLTASEEIIDCAGGGGGYTCLIAEWNSVAGVASSTRGTADVTGGAKSRRRFRAFHLLTVN